jgi:hypothetical protein
MSARAAVRSRQEPSGSNPTVEGISTLKKMENDTSGDGINALQQDRSVGPGGLATTVAGSYASVLVSDFRAAGKDLRALEMLSCWRKLPVEEQEIILDIVRGLLTRMTTGYFL